MSLIMTTDQMTDERKETMREFFLSLGKCVLKCGIPTKATASKKVDSIFGCCGNKCQHLPTIFQGEEMLVIETPLKFAIHASCQVRLIEYLKEKASVYLSPAASGRGVCFDSKAVASKPNYTVMIDALVENCKVENESTHIIHIAELGYRLPLPDKKLMRLIFNGISKMKEVGIVVEIAQFDIAFTVKAPPEQLVRLVSRKRSRQDNSECLLKETTVTSYPLHEAPELVASKRIKPREWKGTINVKKSGWAQNNSRPVLIGSNHPEVDYSGDNNDIVDLFKVHPSHKDNARESIQTHTSDVYSIKAYSDIAHVHLQDRQRYPMSVNSMFAIGHRSVETIQTLLKNLSNTMDAAFNVVEKYGIGLRIEVSVRPHFQSDLRRNGHFNDILLLVCAAIREFCHDTYIGRIELSPSRPVLTKAKKLLSQAFSMIKFRRSESFDTVYANNKVTEWLRCQLSLLMLTMGISPEYGFKFINLWLEDENRYDPFHSLGVRTQNDESGDIARRRIASALRDILTTLSFSEKAREILVTAVSNNFRDPRRLYARLTLKSKHRLANLMWTDIIPNLSKAFIPVQQDGAGEREQEDNNDVGREEGDEEDEEWWSHLGIEPSYLEDLISQAPRPEHPLAVAIYSLVNMSRLWNPCLPGFYQILFRHICICHEEKDLALPSISNGTLQRFQQFAKGSAYPSRRDLQSICRLFKICAGMGNKPVHEYQKLLCRYYGFPSSDVEYKKVSSDRARKMNSCLNEAVVQDIVILMATSQNTNTYHRVFDNDKIVIPRANQVIFQQPDTTNDTNARLISPDLYKVIAACLQTPRGRSVRELIYAKIKSERNLHKIFLTSAGTTNEYFVDTETIEDLEAKHQFMLRSSTRLHEIPKSCNYVPEVVIAIASYTYQTSIAFNNATTNKAYLFLYMDDINKSIKYEGSGIANYTKSTISISLNINRKFQQNRLDHTVRASLTQGDRLGLCSPLGASIISSTTLGFIPNRKTARKDQSCYKALTIQMSKLDNSLYLEDDDDNSNDRIGVIPFIQELATSVIGFNGFDRSVTDLCPDLNRPLSSLASYLRTIGIHDQSHRLVCPLTCLRYNNIILVVFEKAADKTKRTLFYAFNQFSGKVECRTCKDYGKLLGRPNSLYLYSTSVRTEYYAPSDETISQIKFPSSILTEYSYLGSLTYKRLLQALERTCYPNMKLVFPDTDIEDYLLRPEPPNVVVMPTNVVSKKADSIRGLLHLNVRHRALLLIFPGQGTRNEWDACIVYHPHQSETSANEVLQDYIERLSPNSRYKYNCLKGRYLEGCESGHLMLLYSYIGFRCKNMAQFRKSMEMIQNVDSFQQKIRRWVHCILTKHQAGPPAWIEQVTPRTSIRIISNNRRNRNEDS